MIRVGSCSLILLLGTVAPAEAEETKRSYPTPTSFEQFRFADPSEEIAMARSAAPASISNGAEILTLGKQGYETAVKGKNGFVCLIQRSWVNPFDDPEFWNPKIRVSICVNPAAARSVLPDYLQRTRWVLSGVSKAKMAERTSEAIAAHTIPDPLPGAMSYMMSKQGYIHDNVGHWYSHVMFFVPHTDSAAWGANSPGVPVFSQDVGPQPVTFFFVVVPKWSDGSLVFPEGH
jgi:hypothetical protein